MSQYQSDPYPPRPQGETYVMQVPQQPLNIPRPANQPLNIPRPVPSYPATSEQSSPASYMLTIVGFIVLMLSEAVLIGGVAGGAKGSYQGYKYCALFASNNQGPGTGTCDAAIGLASIGLISAFLVVGYLALATHKGQYVSPSLHQSFFYAAVLSALVTLCADIIVAGGTASTCHKANDDGSACSDVFGLFGSLRTTEAAYGFGFLAFAIWLVVAFLEFRKSRQ
ncbi:hypothetical protein BDK51DRAFT_27740 [Blyttiomyces helicus]|uniref:MARVEL domain-containing protein n=1 Tax=Blyttiomyces helicus TaxID=388810 RepID=A0A4P9WA40_9FUNG|nr:hypothetical protein BDK51DRAFT_27740 [Blyttiomyces helicus]|eukprot:RKO89072.1 hypothetical protein BDK51DRAFT_27740 [Blyttiomyces helicus]